MLFYGGIKNAVGMGMGLFSKADKSAEKAGRYATLIDYAIKWGAPAFSALLTVGSPFLPWWRHVQYIAAQEGWLAYPLFFVLFFGGIFVTLKGLVLIYQYILKNWFNIGYRPLTKFRIGQDNSGNHVQEICHNVSWRQSIFRMEMSDPKSSPHHWRADVLSISFDSPVDYERPEINAFGHQIQVVQNEPVGKNGHVIMFDGGLPPKLEVTFPEPGYYKNRSEELDAKE